MKKILSLFVVFSIFLYTVPSAFAQDGGTMDLSLEDAVNIALTDNERLIANEYKQKSDKVNIDSAILTRKPYKNVSVNVSTGFELYCIKEGYYLEAAKMAQRLTKKEAEKLKSSITYDVTEAYYQLVLARKLTGAAQNAYDLSKKNEEIVNSQYTMGLLSQLDFENASLMTMSAQSALDSYTENEKIAEQKLKILLNMAESDSVLNLTDEIECDTYSSDVLADAENAVNTRYDIMALRENMLLSERYFDLASVLTSSSATYNSACASYMEAKYNYNSSVELIKLSVRASYANVKSLEDSLNIAEKQYYLKLREYEASKLKYDLGMLANVELTQAINDLYDAQVSYANAKLNYRMATEKYKYDIAIGL